MNPLIRALRNLSWLAFLVALPAYGEPTIIELSAEASRPAINDLVRATVSAEASGTSQSDIARQVNGLIAEALKTAKAYPSVKAQSGASSTYPNYAKGGKIESWRMRSELSLESGDTAAISELLGKLQSSLAVTNVVLQPSPETRKKVENEAMLDALNAFKARAKVIADALGKPYHLKQISVNTHTGTIQPMMRSAEKAMLSSQAAPMPIEVGESQVSVNISGQITLE